MTSNIIRVTKAKVGRWQEVKLHMGGPYLHAFWFNKDGRHAGKASRQHSMILSDHSIMPVAITIVIQHLTQL